MTFSQKDNGCNLWLVSPKTGLPLRIDIYVQEINLAIEYMREQHYRESFYDKNTFEKIKYNDKMKRKICKEHDVNVIDVKYTWMETEKVIIDILHKNGIEIFK